MKMISLRLPENPHPRQVFQALAQLDDLSKKVDNIPSMVNTEVKPLPHSPVMKNFIKSILP